MRTLMTKTPFALAAVAALTLSACTAESESANAGADDLPETPIGDDPEAISDDEIVEAVPGVEGADAEGDTGNTADLGEEENAEFGEPGTKPPSE